MSRIDNDPRRCRWPWPKRGPDPEVVLAACYRWDWAADLFQAKAPVFIGCIRSVCMSDTRRVESHGRDATASANRLRRNDVPEAWRPGGTSRTAVLGALGGRIDPRCCRASSATSRAPPGF